MSDTGPLRKVAYYDPTYHPLKQPQKQSTNQNVFSVPIILPKNINLEKLRLQGEILKRNNLRAHLMKSDLVNSKFYYNPEQEPSKIEIPDPIGDLLQQQSEKIQERMKTQLYDEFVKDEHDVQYKNSQILNKIKDYQVSEPDYIKLRNQNLAEGVKKQRNLTI